MSNNCYTPQALSIRLKSIVALNKVVVVYVPRRVGKQHSLNNMRMSVIKIHYSWMGRTDVFENTWKGGQLPSLGILLAADERLLWTKHSKSSKLDWTSSCSLTMWKGSELSWAAHHPSKSLKSQVNLWREEHPPCSFSLLDQLELSNVEEARETAANLEDGLRPMTHRPPSNAFVCDTWSRTWQSKLPIEEIVLPV